MGEIKSTLDLVMERTRHLSLTAHERAQQQQDEFDKRLQGLLQQYEDESLTADELEGRISDLQVELKIDDASLIVAGVIKRIDPDQENQVRLSFLSTIAPDLAAPIAETLTDHLERQAATLAASETRLQAQLAGVHGIRGSAVIANPEKDPECQQALGDLRQATLARVDVIAGQTA